jgi:hypothetical protein
MRKCILMLAAICLFLAMVPSTFAKDSDDWALNGKWSVGVGGGFNTDSDKTVAPFVVSAKYWVQNYEIGGEAFTDFQSKSEDNDQIGQAWIAYRYDVMGADDPGAGTTYIGIGGSGIFRDFNTYANSFGPMVLAGWDSDVWGVELKAAYYDPILLSGVVYYHFNTNE